MRSMVNDYYDIQKMRLATEGQLRAIEQEVAEGDDVFLRESIYDRLYAIEKDIYKKLGKDVRGYPIWNEWLKGIMGIGPVLAAGLISHIDDPKRFEHSSALWAYCGLHVVDGRAARRTKGEKFNVNTRLRNVAWLCGESFVKFKGRGSGYGELYDVYKAQYQEKYPEEVKDGKRTLYTKGHIHAMSKRKVVKLFISHLLTVWRDLEGLETVEPWVITHGKHADYIPPFNK